MATDQRDRSGSPAGGRGGAGGGRAVAGRASLLALAGALVCGCAAPTSRLLPAPAAVPALDWAASAPDGTRVAVREVIVRNSPGSWVRDASWDEYLLEVDNPLPVPLTIERIELDSLVAAAAARESTTSRAALEQGSGATLKFAKDAGLIIGSGLAPMGAAVAIVGTGGGFLALSGASMAVAGAAVIVVAPVAITVATLHVVKRHRIQREDAARIEQRLAERGAGVPLAVAAGGRLATSAFFPITPAPTRIGIHYVVGGEPRELWLPLPGLAGLHLQRSASAAPPGATHSGAVQ